MSKPVLGRSFSTVFLKKPKQYPIQWRIVSKESGKHLELTVDDVQQVKESWLKIGDYEKWAQTLFLMMCENKENFKTAFGCDGLDSSQISVLRHFKIHCDNFVKFWRQLVTYLTYDHKPNDAVLESDKNKFVTLIRNLGKNHAGNRNIRFDAETWLYFKTCIIESFCQSISERKKNKTCLAWTKILIFVASEMKSAFNEGIRNRSSSL